jgi:hypothetical protein
MERKRAKTENETLTAMETIHPEFEKGETI